MAQYDRYGADITDEAVACTVAVTIGGGTYYRGKVTQLAAQSVLGNTSPTYGAWTGAGKTGTRLTVVESPAVPANGNELAWDRLSGFVYSTTSRSVFVRYRGHGSFVRERGVVTGVLPGVWEAASVAGQEWRMVAPGGAGDRVTVRNLLVVMAEPFGTTGSTAIRVSEAGVGAGTFVEASVASGAVNGTAGAGSVTVDGGDYFRVYVASAGGHQNVQFAMEWEVE